MPQRSTNNLHEGSVFRTLLVLSLPIIGVNLLHFSYHFIDIFWVGKLGSEAVAGVSSSLFYMNLAWALGSIITMGCQISVSHAVGRKDTKESCKISRTSLITLIVLATVCLIVIQLFHVSFIDFFNLSDTQTEGFAHDYLQWISIGVFFSFTNYLFTAINHAYGDSKTPFRISSVGMILNMILDPILIFYFDLGVIGAAQASVISQFLVTVLFIRFRGKVFFGHYRTWKLYYHYLLKIISLGVPSSLQRIIFTIVSIIIARIIAQWGSYAIAAQKIGLQIESFSFMITGALMLALMSFTGQNFGAKKWDRISKGYQQGLIMSVSFSVVITVVFLIFAEELASLMINDSETVALSASYIRIIGLSQVFMCIEMATSGVINGLGKTKITAAVNISMTVIRIPMAIILSKPNILGLEGIWWSIAISSVLRAILMSVIYHMAVKHQKPVKIKDLFLQVLRMRNTIVKSQER